MELAAVLARGRAAAEEIMTERCVITVRTGDPVFDDVTGEFGATPTAQVYAGKCRIQTRQVQPDVPTSGEHRYVVATLEISLPVSAPSVPVDALITITAATFDSANVGRVFTAGAGLRKSQATAYRIQVTEVLG